MWIFIFSCRIWLEDEGGHQSIKSSEISAIIAYRNRNRNRATSPSAPSRGIYYAKYCGRWVLGKIKNEGARKKGKEGKVKGDNCLFMSYKHQKYYLGIYPSRYGSFGLKKKNPDPQNWTSWYSMEMKQNILYNVYIRY